MILSIIWGSSFILIKKGLIGLTPVQLGCLRILFSSLVLLLVGWRSLQIIKKTEWQWILISGILGTGIPVFLFAFAETEIDSAVASILNSGVPLMALVIGVLLFGARFVKRQFVGVIIGLLGAGALILIGAKVNPNQNYWYALLVVAATLLYALNVNIIKRYLQEVPAMAIATGNFIFLIPPAIVVLIKTDFFALPMTTDSTLLESLGYVAILSVLGTAAAKVMFNKLVQISNPVFASSVTYLMPIVSVTWGLLDGEVFTLWQLLASMIIISGVYIGNRSKKQKLP